MLLLSILYILLKLQFEHVIKFKGFGFINKFSLL